MENRYNYVAKAKVNPPQMLAKILDRKRLIESICNVQGKRVTVITAPGGYGKTVLASQIVKTAERPFVWYQLDEADNDPTVFFYNFTKALSRSIENLNIDLFLSGIVEKDSDKTVYGIVQYLIEKIENLEYDRLYIVLDDFHCIEYEGIVKFINVFLKYLPDAIHIIITSRRYPELDIAKLKASGSLTEVDKNMLAFSYQDFLSLSNMYNYNSSNDIEYKNIYAKSEGWPLALNIFLQESSKYSELFSIQEAKDSQSEDTFFNFFISHVYKNLPEKIKKFLSCISILDEIRPDISQFISGDEDTRDILQYLLKNNMFINNISTDEEVYTCHQLFREFLKSQLGSNIDEMYERAGEYCLLQKRYSDAFEYFIKGRNKDNAFKAFKFAGIEAVRRGRLKTVERWISYFDNTVYEDNEWLSLVKSSDYLYKGMFSSAERCLDDAVKYFEKQQDKYGYYIALTIQARTLFYRSSIGDYIKTADIIINKADEVEDFTLYDAFMQKAYGQIIKGDINEAIITLELGIRIMDRRNNSRLSLFMQRYLTMPYFMKFEYHESIRHYELTNDMSLEEMNITECFSVDLYAARLYRDMGRLDEAKSMMESTIKKKEALGYVEDMASVYYHLATLYRDLGDYESALKYVTLSGELLKSGGSIMEFGYLIEVLKGLIMTDIGKVEEGLKIGEGALLKLMNGQSKFMIEVAYYSTGLISQRAGFIDKSIAYFESGYNMSQKTGVKSMVPVCAGFLAGLYIERDFEKSLFYAKKSIELSAKQDYIQVYVTNPEMDGCIALGFIENVQEDFIMSIIKRLDESRISNICRIIKKHGNLDSLKRLSETAEIDAGLLEESDREIAAALEESYGEEGMYLLNLSKRADKELSKRMIISCFGNFKVFSTYTVNKRVKWRTNKAKELFAYFVHNGGTELYSERILADIWPDTTINKARDLLYTNMSFVKQVLKECNLSDNLVKIQSGYLFKKDGIYCDSWVVDDFYRKGFTSNVDNGIKLRGILSRAYLEDIYSDWALDKRIEYEELKNKIDDEF